MAGPPSSVYYTWGETTKFTCGPSVAGGEATTALMKDPEGGDVGLGVRTGGGCKCVTTVRLVLVGVPLFLSVSVRLPVCVCVCVFFFILIACVHRLTNNRQALRRKETHKCIPKCRDPFVRVPR